MANKKKKQVTGNSAADQSNVRYGNTSNPGQIGSDYSNLLYTQVLPNIMNLLGPRFSGYNPTVKPVYTTTDPAYIKKLSDYMSNIGGLTKSDNPGVSQIGSETTNTNVGIGNTTAPVVPLVTFSVQPTIATQAPTKTVTQTSTPTVTQTVTSTPIKTQTVTSTPVVTQTSTPVVTQTATPTVTQTTTSNAYLDAVNAIYRKDFNRDFNPNSVLDQYWLSQQKAGKESVSDLTKLNQDIAAGAQGVDKATLIKNDITALYQNILGRAPDAEGLAYWTSQFMNGSENAYDLHKAVQDFVSGAGNTKLSIADPYSLIQNGQLVATVAPTAQATTGVVTNPVAANTTTTADTTGNVGVISTAAPATNTVAVTAAPTTTTTDITGNVGLVSTAAPATNTVAVTAAPTTTTDITGNVGVVSTPAPTSSTVAVTTAPTVTQTTTASNSDDLLNKIYQSDFGRAPDAQGAAYWQGQIAANPSLTSDPAALAKQIAGGAAAGSADANYYNKEMTVNPVVVNGQTINPTNLPPDAGPGYIAMLNQANSDPQVAAALAGAVAAHIPGFTIVKDGGAIKANKMKPFVYHNGRWHQG